MGTFSQIANSVPPALSPFNAKKGEDFFGVQAKLSVGKSNDKYEAEADRMADKVVSNKQNNASTSFFSAAPIVQKNQGTEVKKEDQTENEVQQKPLAATVNPLQWQSIQKCDCDNENIQKKEEDGTQTETTANADFEKKLNSTKGGGTALSEDTKAEMESGFDTDFSNVRIHNDSSAVQMNQEIGAQAFASGNDIYFNEGKYNPESTSGKHLIAHELTHTVQQTGTIQRKMGDGHDLKSPRFSGEPKLESAFDDESYIQIGSQGQQVSKIQQALEDSGNPLPKYGVDGIFGPETQGAIRNYQTTNHLLVDGIVGPETMESLDEYFSKPKPKIPPVHPHVCEILQDDPESPTSQKTLFPLNTLSPDLKKAADGAPTVELPNGESAIKCKIPPKEKNVQNYADARFRQSLRDLK
ncbi:eCIS core domain-containing protein [Flavobacterium gyeonganense]|uniref:eCIS core domain-containing protein n=1 Tax=Flavobacterium gyeonganense TaxID=1310418 RepID=UPI002414100F|nr:DUF4157 domain-containing protein [Flavobacterium gyeonganense]